jgi:hypothetical protein
MAFRFEPLIPHADKEGGRYFAVFSQLGQMSFHQERLAAIAAAKASLLAELSELNRLRDRCRKAQFSVGNQQGPDVEIEVAGREPTGRPSRLS